MRFKTGKKLKIIYHYVFFVLGKSSNPNYSKIKGAPILSDFRLAYFTSVSTLYNSLISRKPLIVHFCIFEKNYLRVQLNN